MTAVGELFACQDVLVPQPTTTGGTEFASADASVARDVLQSASVANHSARLSVFRWWSALRPPELAANQASSAAPRSSTSAHTPAEQAVHGPDVQAHMIGE
jgi:hypothetical protein